MTNPVNEQQVNNNAPFRNIWDAFNHYENTGILLYGATHALRKAVEWIRLNPNYNENIKEGRKRGIVDYYNF